MIPLKLDVVADALGGVCRSDDDPQTITIHRVAIDSRDAQTGDLYVAIRGERFDGHRFMAEAVSRGAVACVAQRDHPLAGELSAPVILVDDTVKAMGRLASYYRREVLPASATVIAITGSNGKTTTKRMIDHVLRRSLTGVAAPKNFNNDIGVPLTLLSAPANARYVVVEIGSNAKGEVAALAEMTAPDAAVITSIGEAHMEGLGDLEAIAAEKGSILDHVRPGGLAVVNIDQPEIMPFVRRFTRGRLMTVGANPQAKLCVGGATSTLRSSSFRLEGRFDVHLPMPGAHHATNAAATFAVARWLGVASDEIITSLADFTAPEGRTRSFEAAGVTIIDDAYNANPASVEAAVASFRAAGDTRRILVLGDMLELGETSRACHERVVGKALAAELDVLVAVGAEMTRAAARTVPSDAAMRVYACKDAAEASRWLDRIVSPGDAVWIKGSRAMRLDEVVSHLAGTADREDGRA
ncbi:MAG: UDP-N-acetylmuramoyl-tripeptide--D-alanyl-D-alanine ligase [Planctomycetes bacterium]|nr:UDP-N-acetylmuramoyl-tripeptide--D-alanyl-D-alanine ligase [Planctomycetota bacterium]